MKRHRLVVLSRRGRDALSPEHWAGIEQYAHTTVVRADAAPERAEAVRLLADADLVGATNLCLPRVDAELLDALPRLRGIVLYATGYDHIDVDLLRSRGVGLSVMPDYATTAVAEHCLAMLFALATRLHLANDRSRGRCAPEVSLRGVELTGRTLGVVGVGRIGGEVARRARALGMEVLGTDTDPRAVLRARADGITMVEPERVLGECHVVAVCASHAHGAPPVLGRAELARMRSEALLVNVARSALVETGEVVARVRSGRLRGYAVDDGVLDPERDADVLDQGRVLQTGHSAWWRDEVLERGARMWGERLIAAVRGRPRDAVTWPRQDAESSAAAATEAVVL
ncbi:phosphoglycerate dehydrogenase-like enzyme [Nocardiopsis arvandica]|uniref:Phosphoglycerate dehydrogenase-like enzyme n=1 Tax=Nocardiopsis sinuspersici TaxID=501010 RepID=A0A7Y9XFU7_9ACTN|nr:NAD(P)-dependent oxidoreductase [Nocardiopsis sinuspersici]NYH55134.1 phosphoglycerate dehydrogenase-like enzyme [Nocardiopsis sinuspersici]